MIARETMKHQSEIPIGTLMSIRNYRSLKEYKMKNFKRDPTVTSFLTSFKRKMLYQIESVFE